MGDEDMLKPLDQRVTSESQIAKAKEVQQQSAKDKIPDPKSAAAEQKTAPTKMDKNFGIFLEGAGKTLSTLGTATCLLPLLPLTLGGLLIGVAASEIAKKMGASSDAQEKIIPTTLLICTLGFAGLTGAGKWISDKGIKKQNEYQASKSAPTIQEQPKEFTKEELHVQANALFKDGNYKEALKAYNKLSEIEPNNITFQVLKGKCLERLNQKSEAVQEYQKAQDLSVKQRQGSPVYLQDHINSVEGKEKEVKTLENDAKKHFKEKNYTESLKSFNKLLELNPEDKKASAYYLMSKGQCLQRLGHQAKEIGNDHKAAELQKEALKAFESSNKLVHNPSLKYLIQYSEIELKHNN